MIDNFTNQTNQMTEWMKRAIQLAKLGGRSVAPNPMVGAIIVSRDGNVLAEGYHKVFGQNHAEIEALNKLSDQHRTQLTSATMFVTLEPCCHHGKTPPCIEAILRSGIGRVVIGATDPNPLVAGGGIRAMRAAGIDVVVGVCDLECQDLNKRFLTFVSKKRPYVILKWAQSLDGFIASIPLSRVPITGEEANQLVHRWRSEEGAILVGTNCAVVDNPHLTARYGFSPNPIRLLVDRSGRVPCSHNIFSGVAPTILYTERSLTNSEELVLGRIGGELTIVKLDWSGRIVEQIFADLYQRGINSLIVEGGTKLLNSFIAGAFWDEARVFISPDAMGPGLPAPKLDVPQDGLTMVGRDTLKVFYREKFNRACN